jgi:structural maintenance of chromosomes flexible hinge domain-containing protein 1
MFDFRSNLLLSQDVPFEKVITAGYNHPREIIAVIRPQNATTCSTSLLDKRYIVKDDDLEMAMEIYHLPGSKDHPRAKLIYKKLKKPSSRNSINGLYIFQLSEETSMFTKSGVYSFIFSVVSMITFPVERARNICFLT